MLSRYTNLEKIGAGGMGVVYRAEDATLRRPVALKFLTETSYAEEQQRARFLREAQMAAALNHPNICTVYEVGEVREGEEDLLGGTHRLVAGTAFLAMEFIEGPTLETRLAGVGRMEQDALLDVAIAVAEGLAAAHAKGIVHRDLKPGNVMLTEDGRAKILDFGLAKPSATALEDDPVLSMAGTVSADLTRKGQVLGTVAYMSPEQALGKPLDSRSDVFSFGIMLHEMAAGIRPFQGESAAATLAKLLEADPQPLSEIRSDLPPELHRIVRRCLKKNSDDRYNDTRDLVAALRDLRQVTSATTAVASEAVVSRPTARWGFLAAGALVVVAMAAAAAAWYAATGDDPAPAERAAAVHRQMTFTGNARVPTISPDGRSIAYVVGLEGEMSVQIQDVAGGDPLEILNSNYVDFVEWSPDGSQLHVDAELKDGKLANLLIPRLGGNPRPIWDGGFRKAVWSPDGTRMAGARIWKKEMSVLDLASGEVTSFPLDSEVTWVFSTRWSPDGRRLLFLTVDAQESSALWTVEVDGEGLQKIVEQSASIVSPQWAPGGAAIYYLAQSGLATDLMRLRVDPKSGATAGEPVVVLSGLKSQAFSLSQDGRTMLYERNNRHSNLIQIEILPGDAKPVFTPLTSGTLMHEYPSLSPDGESVAFVRNGNVFVMNLVDGEARPLTFKPATRWSPVWSPTGKEIAFGSNEGGRPQIWRVPASGGAARPFEGTRPSQNGVVVSWSPGSELVYPKPGNRNLQLLDPTTGTIRSLIEDESQGWIFDPKFSPDGRKLAVMRNMNGDHGLWVFSLDSMTAEKIWDTADALPLRWSADGAWIYASEAERIVRYPAAGGPAELFIQTPPTVNWQGQSDLDADGTRAVFVKTDAFTDLWLIENFDQR